VAGRRGNGAIFYRGQRIWLRYRNADGRQIRQPTPFARGQEEDAKKLLAAVFTAVHAPTPAEELTPPLKEQPLTVEAYAKTWLAKLEASGKTSALETRSHLAVACKKVGSLLLATVTKQDVKALLAWIKTEARTETGVPYAPRTQRHIFSAFRGLIQAAEDDEIITESENPFTLRLLRALKKDIPKVQDKDPTWRRKAVYTLAELTSLVSDSRIDLLQRTFAACMGLGGMRYGEVAALRWGALNADTDPLACLTVHRAYNSNVKKEKSTKTDCPREVPVHPFLAGLLAEWRQAWPEHVGRDPEDEDLIFPVRVRRGGFSYRTKKVGMIEHKAAEAQLGLRHRRQHDLRRTFISLCLGAGAAEKLLKWITHGQSKTIMDQYTTPPWDSLCKQVLLLKIEAPKLAVPTIRAQSEHTDEKVLRFQEKMVEALGIEGGSLEPVLCGQESPEIPHKSPLSQIVLRSHSGPEKTSEDIDCASVLETLPEPVSLWDLMAELAPGWNQLTPPPKKES
jgi:integrase